MDKTRQADYKVIERGLGSSDSSVRRQAEHAAWKIQHESTRVKNMREVLVKAHQRGDVGEIKDIHDFMRNKGEYQNAR